jgi:glucose-6-phosphate 1-dehydrogenase
VKVLKSLRRIDRSNVRENRSRPVHRRLCQGKKVPGYLEEEGANKPATPRPSWRSAWISTTGAGRAFRSTCVPVNVCHQMFRSGGLLQNPELNLFKESWQELPQNN